MNWPFPSFNRHLIEENDWLRAQLRLSQAKLDRLEAAVWAQQSPAGAAYAQSQSRTNTTALPGPTISTWEAFEKDFYATAGEAAAKEFVEQTEQLGARLYGEPSKETKQ